MEDYFSFCIFPTDFFHLYSGLYWANPLTNDNVMYLPFHFAEEWWTWLRDKLMLVNRNRQLHVIVVVSWVLISSWCSTQWRTFQRKRVIVYVQTDWFYTCHLSLIENKCHKRVIPDSYWKVFVHVSPLYMRKWPWGMSLNI